MKLSFYLLSICTLLFFFSCEKDDNTDPIACNTGSGDINFNGITGTDENGAILGNIDPADWQKDDTWNDRENSLFGKPPKPLCTNLPNTIILAAYPNPAMNIINMGFGEIDSFYLDIRVVDQSYNILIEQDDVFFEQGPFHNLSLNLENVVPSQDTARIYYRLYIDDCELRGHGDVVNQ